MILKMESECLVDMDNNNDTAEKLDIAEPTTVITAYHCHLFNDNKETESISTLLDPSQLVPFDLCSPPSLISEEADEPTTPKKGSRRPLLSAEENRQRVLLRNREAAKASRKKKKQYVQDMEQRVNKLINDNRILHQQVNQLRSQLQLVTRKNEFKAATNE